MTPPDQAAIAVQSPPREFSDLAILRGALTSAVAAYFLPTIVAPIVMSPDPGMTLQTLPYLLGAVLRFEILFMGLLLTSALSIVGLIFLVRDKRGYTTYAAAARAGAKTALFVMVVAGALFILPHIAAALFTGRFGLPGFDLAVVAQLAGGSLGTIGVGALAGLAGRLAAGTPRTKPALDPA